MSTFLGDAASAIAGVMPSKEGLYDAVSAAAEYVPTKEQVCEVAAAAAEYLPTKEQVGAATAAVYEYVKPADVSEGLVKTRVKEFESGILPHDIRVFEYVGEDAPSDALATESTFSRVIEREATLEEQKEFFKNKAKDGAQKLEAAKLASSAEESMRALDYVSLADRKSSLADRMCELALKDDKEGLDTAESEELEELKKEWENLDREIGRYNSCTSKMEALDADIKDLEAAFKASDNEEEKEEINAQLAGKTEQYNALAEGSLNNYIAFQFKGDFPGPKEVDEVAEYEKIDEVTEEKIGVITRVMREISLIKEDRSVFIMTHYDEANLNSVIAHEGAKQILFVGSKKEASDMQHYLRQKLGVSYGADGMNFGGNLTVRCIETDFDPFTIDEESLSAHVDSLNSMIGTINSVHPIITQFS